ncbi:MAG: hypothetical protein RRY34_03560 [Victivallaceae bacterium]
MKDFWLNIRYLLSYLLVASIMKFIKIMPHKFVVSSAGAIAGLVYKLKFIRQLIQANLAAAMPELSASERESIGRKSMRNVAVNMIEFIWLSGNPKRIRQVYQLPEEVCAQLKQFVADEVRIIFVNPHLGSWEASGVMAPFYAGVKMCQTYAQPIFESSAQSGQPGEDQRFGNHLHQGGDAGRHQGAAPRLGTGDAD